MKSLKYNVLKSIIYILIFAGLLKLSGLIISWFWNEILVKNYNFHPITFLEATGILAFLYLVFAGVKFGFDNISNMNLFNSKELKPGNLPQCKECDKVQSSYILRSKLLSLEEKERLKEAIAKCCGMNNHSHLNNLPTQKINIQQNKTDNFNS